MNERIKELASKAGLYKDLDGMPWLQNLGYSETEEAYKKFAELIVKECAKFAEQHIDERCGRDFMVGVKLKEHFGVE
jgi:hypothetical protein